jgi:hypothetical protein
VGGRKLSAKVEEEVVFMEHMLLQADTLNRKVEEYASAKKNADAVCQQITRELSMMRQRAMMKNLGPLADSAGTLGILAGRGSQVQRTRVMREGLVSFKQLIERMMKATIDADARVRAESEQAMAKAREGGH